MLTFTKTDPSENRKSRNRYRELYEDLCEFLTVSERGMDYLIGYAGEEKHYNNNNDLRRAIYDMAHRNDLPIYVYMVNGDVYIRRMV